MIEILVRHLTSYGHALAQAVRSRRHPHPGEGATSVEILILALGMIVLATAVVAALTRAVNSRISLLN